MVIHGSLGGIRCGKDVRRADAMVAALLQ
jgi:hypothetical protein